MKQCPKCKTNIENNSPSCAKCGIIFEKYKTAQQKREAIEKKTIEQKSKNTKKISDKKLKKKHIFITGALIIVLVGLFFVFKPPGIDDKIAEEKRISEFFKKELQKLSIELDNKDCSHFIETTIDKVTGRSSTHGKSNIMLTNLDDPILEERLYVQLYEKIIVFKAVGAGSCIDKGSPIYILFRDGSKMKLKNDKKFNCDNMAHVVFYGSDMLSQLQELQEKEIETIRVHTRKSYIEEDFTEIQSKMFKHTLRCLEE